MCVLSPYNMTGRKINFIVLRENEAASNHFVIVPQIELHYSYSKSLL